MGTRPAKKSARPPVRPPQPHAHTHGDQDKPPLQVDANRVIRNLQQQRADLQAQNDILAAALEESQEREQQMLVRIAELEDKPEPEEK